MGTAGTGMIGSHTEMLSMRLAFWFRSVLFAVVLLMAANPASARVSVTGVRLGAQSDVVTRLVLDVSGTAPFRIQLHADPYRVVIAAADMVWSADAAVRKAVGAIAAVRYDTDDGGQVVVELRRPVKVKTNFMLSPGGGLGWRFVLDLEDTTPQAFPAAPAPPPSVPAVVAAPDPPVPAAVVLDEASARSLVQAAVADMLESFAGKKLTPEQAKAAMQHMVDRYCDMEVESRQILGRYWSLATPDQQKEFKRLLERFFVTMVGGMIDEVPADQRIKITGAERGGDRVVVHSLAYIPSEPASAVHWTVMAGTSGRLVIADVSTDGVSLVPTLQADFTAVIRTAAGGIESLFEPLRKKVSGLPAATAAPLRQEPLRIME